MSEPPENIQRKIAQIESMRSTLGDAAVDAAIAALRAQQAPPAATPQATQDIHAGGSISHVEQSYREGDAVHGEVNVTDAASTQGPVTGINYGTIQAFFGDTPPQDGKALLAAYLASLTSECQQLRLSRLVRDQQMGSEQQRVPHLKLQAVYTSLTTSGEAITVAQRSYPAVRMKRLIERLRERPATEVPPEQVRDIDLAFCTEPDETFYKRIGKQREELSLDDLPDDILLCLTITRPKLATEAIRQVPRLVLLGEPGSGKSTVLRYLALLFALHIQGNPVTLPIGWNDLEAQGASLPVPIFCPLGSVASLLSQGISADVALWTVIERALDDAQSSRKGLLTHLQSALLRGGVLPLFDGLDELPTSGDNPRAQVAQAVRRFAIKTAPNTPLVITSRTRPYKESQEWQMPEEEGWQALTIQPLTFGQVRHFVEHWYAELASTREKEQHQERAAKLMADLQNTQNERIRKLITSPLLLTMLAILHYNRNEIPDDRVEVYEQCVELLLDRWESVRTPDVKRQSLLARLDIPELKVEQLREELHKLALHTHRQPPGDDGRGMLDGATLTGHMVRFFGRLRCPDPLEKVNLFLDGLVKEAGLLQAPSDDHYAFPHLTFQEYLTACGLADRQDMVAQAYEMWSGADASRWREVLLLLMGRLRQRGSLSVEQYGVAWLDRLLAKKIGRQAKTAAQRWQDIALATLCYREIGGATALASVDIDVEEKLEQPLRTNIVELLATRDSGVVVADRIVAAEVLAELGDPRLLDPATGTSSTGDYWCAVEAGTFWFGDDDEGVLRQMTLPGDFQIGRYPVTNAEYARFIAAGGYHEQRWWTDEGWKYKEQRNRTQPYSFSQKRLSQPTQPVQGWWYEAMAYCRWLTAQGHNAGWLATQEIIRLPTSLEWERAARHTDKRRYPWGEEQITSDHANGKETGIGTASPVGCFPRGAAVCGAQDMLGNVWEWTATPYQQEEQMEPQPDFKPGDRVVLTWSYFGDKLERMFCGSRYGYFAGDCFFVGFRLLRSLAHPNNSSGF
jgi:formylglycine-generating enzyme required for sulfatase activity